MTIRTPHIFFFLVLSVVFSTTLFAVDAFGACVDGVGCVSANQGSPGGFVPIVGVPGIELSGDSSISDVLNALFRIAIVGAGVLAVIYIIIGGFEYMVSGAREAKKDGRERIQGAVIGLLLLLSSYIILAVINPDLLNLDPFRTTLTPGTGQGPAAPGGGANAGGGGTPQTPQAGGENSTLPPRWKSEVDAQSLSELKRNYELTCTNPGSPSYQGEAKCQYIQGRIAVLEGGTQTPGGETTPQQDGTAEEGAAPRASESCTELKPGDATCTIKTNVGKSGKDIQNRAESQCRSAGGVSNTQYYCERNPENKYSDPVFCGLSGSFRIVEVTCRAETQRTVTNIPSDSWFARARTSARQCQEVNKGNPTYSDCNGANPGTRTSMPFCVSGLGPVTLSVTCTY